MRVSFSSMTAARAAVCVLEAYGYTAKQTGTRVVTDCPTLLAVPALQKQVGLAEIDQLDLTGGADVRDLESDDFSGVAQMERVATRSEMSA
jgi:hypothetical protein